MKDIITVEQLKSRVKYLNFITGNKENPWERSEDGNIKANIGTFYLDGAYGGYDVCQIMNESGGVNSLFNYHMPKREIYDKLNTFISGIEFNKRRK